LDTVAAVDYETQWMFEIQRHGKSFDYKTLAFDYYEALRELGIDVDFVPATADLSGYQLVVVPSIAVIDDALVRQIERSSAQWVFGPRSGSKTGAFAIPGNLPPGALQQVLPMQVLEVESLRPTLQPSLSIGGENGIAVHWREHVRANGNAQVDTRFEDGWPAIVSHGCVRYVAAWLSHSLHRALLQQAASHAGVARRTAHAPTRRRDICVQLRRRAATRSSGVEREVRARRSATRDR
jgi:beta-galactosidase